MKFYSVGFSNDVYGLFSGNRSWKSKPFHYDSQASHFVGSVGVDFPLCRIKIRMVYVYGNGNDCGFCMFDTI